MAIKTLRVFAEYTSTGFVPMPTAGGIDYGYTLASTFPSTTPSSFQTDDPDIDVTVTAMTDFYVWIRISGTAWNPSYTRNVRVYPDSPDINNVVMNMIIATGPAGVSAYTQIVQTANRLYFNGATTDSVYNSKFAGKTYINELNFGTAPQLATVATSGAYADLTGKPALATVATSGSYADLSSKPSGTAPISYNSGTNSFQITQANSTTNGFLTSTDWNTFNNKYLLPSGGTTAQYLRGDGTLATFPTTLDSTRLILNGRNTTGTTLAKGTVVYINGVSGNTPLFARAIASADSTSAQTLGVVEFDIPNNSNGVVVLVGAVNNLDTSSYTEGVQLYLSGTVAGAFTSSKILAPTHLVYVGIVTRAHPTLGVVEVKIQNGYELDEIHDVQISSPADKHILYYDNATTLWKHSSVTSVLGFTPYNATNPSNYIALTALSASAPLSYNNTTGAFSISQANGSTNGFLSSTDWTTFNSKQNALTLGNVSEVSSNVLMFPDGGTGKTIGNLSIQVVQAGATTNGYLSSADWTTFNNKQGTITLTTTGTSGAATFSSGTLNIPNYGSALTGYVTLDTTQTISGAKTFSSALNGTSATFSSNINGTGENTYMGIDAATVPRLGFVKISNAQPFIGFGADTFTIRVSSGSTIATSNTFSTALSITTSSNVGIGTATPQERFEVAGINGNIRIYGRTGVGENQIASNVYWNGSAWVRDNSSYGAVAIQLDSTNSRLIFSTTSATSGYPTERMRISSDGQIIAGDSSLAYTNAQGYVAGFKSATISQTFISIARSGQTLGSGGVNIGLDQTAAYFYVNDNLPTVFRNNAVERVRISASGNLGIGNNAPDTSYNAGNWFNNGGLVIGNITSTSGLQINSSTTSTLSAIRFGDGDGANNLYDQGFIIYNHNLNKMSIGTNRSTALVIEDTGIITLNGAITDYSRFNIKQSTGTPYGGLNIYSNNGTQSFLGIGCTGGVCSLVATYGTSGSYLPITFQTGGSETMRMNTSGNVSLSYQGDAGYRLYVSGTIYATGNITANSDLTLKKNLKLIENPIDKLMSLNGYLYQWKESDEYQYGVIAQEIEKILPHAVSTGTNGIKGVSYNQIIPVLIEAIKELNAKLDSK